ncbi:unnamed protein product [Parascedosporium putredinis]|uniref:tyrosinase n=1 Tax=Parascedosporium putredinis TaxID=1442378 RepID=A0A9P1H6D2_9PEZI|nr:unnamed protein product [Parascedosporium putredinis]CAI7997506.1 unnamed protein product [Parascedosporium putredinis]
MSTLNNLPVVGVKVTPTPDGSVPLRREIRELQERFPEQFSIFILAMRALQAKDKNDPTSFQFGGYCTHSSILFLTWHRPYLALLEQSLSATAQTIASQYPENIRSRYVEAAKQLRLPYFDWATRVREPAPSLPNSIAQARISIVDIDGRQKTIDNPLFSFNISQVQPDRGDLAGTLIEQELDNESASLRQELSLLLLSVTDYDDFSNSTWRTGGRLRATTSLESVHDDIHGRAGGSRGHMSSLDVSAMDPIFWLHHCNVDRVWAMWQDLNPDEFMSARPAPFTNFTVQAGAIEDEKSPLSPFWDETGTRFWTSDRVKSTITFGYAYPETQRWGYATLAAYQQAMRRTIASLYGSNPFLNFAQTIAPKDVAAERPTFESLAANPSSMMGVRSLAANVKLAARSVPAQVPLGEEPKAAENNIRLAAVEDHKEAPQPPAEAPKAPSTAPAAQEATPPPPQNPIQKGNLSDPIPDDMKRLCPGGHYTDWVVNVRAQKHGLGQTFRIIVFLGDFSPDAADWAGNAEYNTVGRVTMLGRSSETQCGNLKPEDVVPHLKTDLHWRAKVFEGTEFPIDQIPGLKVSVCSMPVTLGDDGVPVFSGEYTVHPEATAGKAGGLEGADEW